MTQNKFIPTYARLPLLAVVFINFFTYYIAKLLSSGLEHHTTLIGLDGVIPFVPFFVGFYVIAYAQWVIGYVSATRDGKELFFWMFSANIISKIICLVFFVAFPTTMERPEITGSGVFNWLTGVIYYFDTPVNLFPSIHCLESWLCVRAALRSKAHKPVLKALTTIIALLVFASTVFIKQHVVLDVIGGIAVAEIGIAIAQRIRLGSLFSRLNAAFFEKISLRSPADRRTR